MLKLLGYELANMTDGGEGCSGRQITDEYRLKYHFMCLGERNPNYGHRWTKEMKDNLSMKAKARKNNLGDNPNAKRVMCVETGKIYDCIRTPQEELGLKANGSITVAIKNPKKTARGFHWVGENKFNELDNEEKRKEYLNNLSE